MRFALLLFLLSPAYAADPPKVPTVVALPGPLKPVDATAPSKVAVGTFRFVTLTGHEGPVTWDFTGAGLKTFDATGPVIGTHADGPAEPDVYTPPAGPCLAVFGRVPGTVTVAAWGIRDGKPAKVASLVIEVTGARPPPEPGPGPKPEPTPTPSTSPFTESGFRVLMTFDPNPPTPRSGEQNSVLYGKAVREYLDSHCVKGPDGRTAEARIYASNTDLSADRPTWRDAFGKRGGSDWILIGDGKSGYSGPLPKNEADALELLRKYGGQ